MRKALATLLALALALLMVGAPAEAARPGTRYQRAAFEATNQQRAAHHRAALHHQRCVQRFAVKQATRMAHQRRMFHQDLGRVLRRCGLRTAGENVAYGYPTGRAVVNRGWMHSAPHRANILRRGYRLLGVAARKGADGRWYAAQVFGRE